MFVKSRLLLALSRLCHCERQATEMNAIFPEPWYVSVSRVAASALNKVALIFLSSRSTTGDAVPSSYVETGFPI